MKHTQQPYQGEEMRNMTTQAASEMQRYISRIRNAEKKDYATRYAIWLARPKDERAEIAEPQPFHLSYMGAQAVRNSLYAILSAYPKQYSAC